MICVCIVLHQRQRHQQRSPLTTFSMISSSLVHYYLAISSLGVAGCLAFTPPAGRRVVLPMPSRQQHDDALTLKMMADDDGDARGVDVASVLSSLPSPEAVKDNIMEGKVGARGEQYVVAQFGLLFFIAIGSVPFIGDALISTLGSAMIVAGLFLVYRSAADLKDNLSPWPVPVDPKTGRGSLVNGGIYGYIRHPMYAGLLCGMVGLSLFTDSASRLLSTGILYFVLDAKSDYEEEKLIQTYGSAYEGYQKEVEGKFFPKSIDDISVPEWMILMM